MTLTRITAPAVEPVTLMEVKAHIHVDHNDEDVRIAGFILTAARKLDGRDGRLGRCLIAQTWRLTLDRFLNEIVLPLPPCISVDRISYLNSNGGEVDVAGADYRVTGLGSLDGARIRAARGKSWPDTFHTDSAFVEFTCGFGVGPGDVPEPLRTAIMMHVGHLYEHRESVMLGTGFIAEVPHGYEDLIRDYRVWSF
jgi:uncharacterized phiE125 gp8 family phage protein